MERDEARNFIVGTNEILEDEEIEKLQSVSWTKKLFNSLIEKRKATNFPWEGISNSIIYTIKNSNELDAYCAPSGKYNVIVITKGLLIFFERVSRVLSLIQLLSDNEKKTSRQGVGIKSIGNCGIILNALLSNQTDDIDSKIDSLLMPYQQNEYFSRWGGAFLQILILFVLEHEYMHVVSGHLELQNVIDNSGRHILDKPMWSGVGNLLRTCEVSADIKAIESTFKSSFEQIGSLVRMTNESESENLKRFIVSSSLPITILFSLRTLYPSRKTLMRWASHPPGIYRLFAVYRIIPKLIEHEFESLNPSEASLIQRKWMSTSVKLQSKTGIWLFEVDENGSVIMPPNDEAINYYISQSFGLNKWPELKKMCFNGLIERVYNN